jgi:hypothetical protein
MKCIIAVAAALSLAGCGGTGQPEANIAAEDVNAMTNLEETPPLAPEANAAVEEARTEAPRPVPAATRPAPAKPAPATPTPAPPPPKPAPAAEPTAPDPTCPPEHHAAGHC